MATLARYQFTVVNELGNIQPSASVEVRNESGGGLAPLFSDRAGTVGISNPFTADGVTAFAFFHVVAGAYKITATLGAFSREYRYVGIGTASENDFDTISSQIASAVTTQVNAQLAAISLHSGFSLINGKLVTSVAANAFTVAIKHSSGVDPSSSFPVYVVFRNVTATDGSYSVLTLTAATSFVFSSGSTAGFTSAIASRLWFVAFNDAGTLRLGAINCRSGKNIYPLGQFPIASSTAEGGAGAADSAQVFYTGTAVSAKPYAILGYADWNTGLVTAGTWAAGPTRLHLYAPGTPLPGQSVQSLRTSTGAVATGTTLIPSDDTVPQITEGDQYFSQAIVPVGAPNVLRFDYRAGIASSALGQMTAALFQDATANAIAASQLGIPTINSETISILQYETIASTVASTTFKIRQGQNNAGTTTLNGITGTRTMGGVTSSGLTIEEIMS